MVQIYVSLILKGATCPKTGEPYTLVDVPARIRAQVEAALQQE